MLAERTEPRVTLTLGHREPSGIKMLTPAQKRSFDEAGYLVREGALRGELLERVRHEAEALSAGEAPRSDTLPGEVQVPVPAGTAVFFDAALWHTGDRNRSATDRLALFPYFGRYFIKRMDNFFTQPLPADLLATTDPMKRQLLGLGLRAGVPSYPGDDETYNRRGEPGMRFPTGP